MDKTRFLASAMLMLDNNIPDLPCYNYIVSVGSDGLGSSFASDIAKGFLEKDIWTKDNFQKLFEYLNFESLKSSINLQILDRPVIKHIDVEDILNTTTHTMLKIIENRAQ